MIPTETPQLARLAPRDTLAAAMPVRGHGFGLIWNEAAEPLVEKKNTDISAQTDPVPTDDVLIQDGIPQTDSLAPVDPVPTQQQDNTLSTASIGMGAPFKFGPKHDGQTTHQGVVPENAHSLALLDAKSIIGSATDGSPASKVADALNARLHVEPQTTAKMTNDIAHFSAADGPLVPRTADQDDLAPTVKLPENTGKIQPATIDQKSIRNQTLHLMHGSQPFEEQAQSNALPSPVIGVERMSEALNVPAKPIGGDLRYANKFEVRRSTGVDVPVQTVPRADAVRQDLATSQYTAPQTSVLVPSPLLTADFDTVQDSFQKLDIGLNPHGAAAPDLRSGMVHPMQMHAPQVAQKIAVATVQMSGATTEIALNPEELGRIRIAITPADAGISVSIFAERPETAELMRRNIELLAREFREMGHENVSFSFGESSQNPPDQGQSNPQSEHSGEFVSQENSNLSPTVTVALRSGLDLKL